MAIPKKMQDKYDEIASYVVSLCDERLNEEYRDLCLAALEELCRKRPSPLMRGRPNTWAAGIVYAIAQNNWIFDKHSETSMTADELAAPFGVAKSTASNKAAEIGRMPKMDHCNGEWVLASDLEKNSLVWWVEVNGLPMDARPLLLDLQIACHERGLIPYVPALKGHEDRGGKED